MKKSLMVLMLASVGLMLAGCPKKPAVKATAAAT